MEYLGEKWDRFIRNYLMYCSNLANRIFIKLTLTCCN